MSIRKARACYTSTFTFVGAIAGYFYAKHSVAETVAHMRAKWGWVCGTGLDIPFYLWTPIGSLVGLLFGIFSWRLFVRFTNSADRQ